MVILKYDLKYCLVWFIVLFICYIIPVFAVAAKSRYLFKQIY